jgi:hypothetical protein
VQHKEVAQSRLRDWFSFFLLQKSIYLKKLISDLRQTCFSFGIHVKILFMPFSRPALTLDLTAKQFSQHYYLKSELLEFCRQHSLPTAGGKPELNQRIITFLETGKIISISSKTRSSTKNLKPVELTLETAIWQGMTCTQQLSAFFKTQIGSNFQFNKTMRDFIHSGVGSTLNEYNRHFREFFAKNKGATRAQAIAAWWEKRGKPSI